ncbi:hypothetical protein RGU70_16115 [Herbaspirillum sp. RTI4]|uniref:hypothetical protein n=1 Tax=Herbaspirillum sp. RTI4 TaxID=3048640 RepID=UPI002AB3CD53|nr:hypothetical protein [Herbaspirillum sp. RTI4]MDY7579841.1 hypothetical protein [Herbaspirillum sp. RTI4]MEA9981928.1 hypothetical protein [Herbaspirillum sp. RTI4]
MPLSGPKTGNSIPLQCMPCAIKNITSDHVGSDKKSASLPLTKRFIAARNNALGAIVPTFFGEATSSAALASGISVGIAATLNQSAASLFGIGMAAAFIGAGCELAAGNFIEDVRWRYTDEHNRLTEGLDHARMILCVAHAALGNAEYQEEIAWLNGVFFKHVKTDEKEVSDNITRTIEAADFMKKNMHKFSGFDSESIPADAFALKAALMTNSFVTRHFRKYIHVKNSFLKNASKENIAHLLIHELTHIALGTNDMGGSALSAPEKLIDMLHYLNKVRISPLRNAEVNAQYIAYLSDLVMHGARYKKNKMALEGRNLEVFIAATIKAEPLHAVPQKHLRRKSLG